MIVLLANSVNCTCLIELAEGIVIYPKSITEVLVGTVVTMAIFLELVERTQVTDSSKTPEKRLENGHSHGGSRRTFVTICFSRRFQPS